MINFEERMERLLAELGDQRWDLLVLTETWREGRDEAFTIDRGHSWFGSGGSKGRCGVGFLLHRRWNHSFFKPISERCASLGIKISSRLNIHIIGAYMPHGGHEDAEVEAVYAEIQQECRKARENDAGIIIAGDFNAEVGSRDDYDNPAILGDNPMPSRNDRGNMLLQWCALLGLALANTFGCSSADTAWTYRNGEERKQLDYILIDLALVRHTLSCSVLVGVDIGSDHRPVLHELACCVPSKRRRKKKKCPKTWRPDASYVSAVDSSLATAGSTQGVAEKSSLIRNVLVNSLPASPTDDPTSDSACPSAPVDATLAVLIQERRNLIANEGLCPQERKRQRVALGKNIQKHIRNRQAQQKVEKIMQVLGDFRDLKQISDLTGKKVNTSIVEVLDIHGKSCRSKSEIVGVFATFYEELYRSRRTDQSQHHSQSNSSSIPPFSVGELRAALKKMKVGKARDSEGIAAEMLKIDCEALQHLIVELFNEVLSSSALPPDWRKSRLIVLFKKGDPKLPSNYRPIAILPLLYKLFSRMLCARLEERIIGQQSVDQAAYRKGYSTDDHLLTVGLLLERCSEWSAELWLGLVDFEKAFDTVEHTPLWNALSELGVEQPYIDLLKIIYSEQAATVSAGAESRAFSLERGVKQGDPISPLLFLAVMEVMFRRLKTRWNKLNTRRSGPFYGIVIDRAEDPLTNLRFADDVLVFASTPSDISKMILDLSKEASKFGLKMHMGKTVVLTNRSEEDCPASVKCGGVAVKVAGADDSERYLGRKLSITEFHEIEFKNRLASAWSAFFKFKACLCCRKVPLNYRMKLFECCVTPCALYSCGTWALSAEMVRKLRSTRRKMIRWIVGVPRHIDEDWVAFIQRATHRSEQLAESYGSTDWVLLYRQRKWKLAEKAANYSDNRWAQRILQWTPWFRTLPHRRVGRPCKRWDDDLVALAGDDWPASARNGILWAAAASAYIDGAS